MRVGSIGFDVNGFVAGFLASCGAGIGSILSNPQTSAALISIIVGASAALNMLLWGATAYIRAFLRNRIVKLDADSERVEMTTARYKAVSSGKQKDKVHDSEGFGIPRGSEPPKR